jgi:hypothetical protein
MPELFASICTQMSYLQYAPAYVNDRSTDRIEYYRNLLTTMSNSQRPLILMIDGIEDLTGQSSHGSWMIYYQALLQLLPPKVRQRVNSIDIDCVPSCDVYMTCLVCT